MRFLLRVSNREEKQQNSFEKNQNKSMEKSEIFKANFHSFRPIDCNTIPSSRVRVRVFYIFLSLLLSLLKRFKARIYIYTRDRAAIFLSRRDRKERESAFLQELGAREKSDHIIIIQIIIEKRSASSFRTSK